MFNKELLGRWFNEIDSSIRVRKTPRGRSDDPIIFNAVDRDNGSNFTATISSQFNNDDFDVVLIDIDKKNKHLLLSISYKEKNRKIINKILFGHDERHWFVSGISSDVKNIREAFEKLKPNEARLSQRRFNVRNKDINRRKNKGFIRQGEWFFVPSAFEPDETDFVNKDEPIQAGRRSKHMCEFLVRKGGETVYVNQTIAPNGFTLKQKEKYLKNHPTFSGLFSTMRRNATVYVKGKVTHKDHKTVELKSWHEVFMSRETSNSSNAFLD